MSDSSHKDPENPTLYLTKVLGGKVFQKTLSLKGKAAADVLAGQGYALFVKGEKTTLLKKKLSLQCPKCGCSQVQFEKTGRFGCDYCYKTFGFFLPAIFRKMHSGTRHLGKIPAKSMSPELIQERIVRLREDMDRAVKKENYEEASRLRDEIRTMDLRLHAVLSVPDSFVANGPDKV